MDDSVMSAEEAASMGRGGGVPGEGLWMSLWRLQSPQIARVPLAL